MIKAILFDENIVLPVSAMLNGEYGESGVYAGIPAVINRNGVKELVEYHLTAQEQTQLKQSIHILREADSRLHI